MRDVILCFSVNFAIKQINLERDLPATACELRQRVATELQMDPHSYHFVKFRSLHRELHAANKTRTPAVVCETVLPFANFLQCCCASWFHTLPIVLHFASKVIVSNLECPYSVSVECIIALLWNWVAMWY